MTSDRDTLLIFAYRYGCEYIKRNGDQITLSRDATGKNIIKLFQSDLFNNLENGKPYNIMQVLTTI